MSHSFAMFLSQYAPIGSSERPWTATQKRSTPSSWWARAAQILVCLLAHIHVFLTQFRPHRKVNSTEMKTYFHTPTMALRLHSLPHRRLPIHRPFRLLLPALSYPPYTLANKCLNYLNHLFLPGQPKERHC